MAKQSKRMKALAAKAPGANPLPLAQAVTVLKSFDTTKFDQTVEIAIRLGVDPKQADQLVRGSIVLPHGIGKKLRVIVFAKGDKVDEAKEAGADEIVKRKAADLNAQDADHARRMIEGTARSMGLDVVD